MKKNKNDATYEVGYGKPPKANRFKPGSSGNMDGRPKGAQSFGLYLSKALNKRASVTIDGKTERLTLKEIIVKQLMNGALKGNFKDVVLSIDLMERFEDSSFKPIMKIVVIENESDR